MAEKSKNSSPLVSFTGQARTRQRSRASSTPLFWAGLREGGPLGTAEVGFSLLGGGSREPPGWSPPPPPRGPLMRPPKPTRHPGQNGERQGLELIGRVGVLKVSVRNVPMVIMKVCSFSFHMTAIGEGGFLTRSVPDSHSASVCIINLFGSTGDGESDL